LLLSVDVAPARLPDVIDDCVPDGFSVALFGKVDVPTKIFSHSVKNSLERLICRKQGGGFFTKRTWGGWPTLSPGFGEGWGNQNFCLGMGLIAGTTPIFSRLRPVQCDSISTTLSSS
jgi:hypothetical protein